MRVRTVVLFVLGLSGAAAPVAASAQAYGQPYYDAPAGQGYQQPYYGNPRGDWYGGRRAFGGYPEFRGAEMHIRREIEEAVRDDMIEPDDARDLMGQLRRIQAEEAREFSYHGWRLPDDDRARISDQLDRLDQVVDQTRDEP